MSSTREKIAQAADTLFYEQGFEATSFADIAGAVGISRGNFYHHFKTKDEILDAVIDRRIAKTKGMMETWDAQGQTPLDRIGCFIRILIRNRAKITQFGCPVGSLVSELGKLNHVSQSRANALFSMFGDWLAEQFQEMGCDAPTAVRHARHLLARSQGVATLSQALQDDEFIDGEVVLMLDYAAAAASEFTQEGN